MTGGIRQGNNNRQPKMNRNSYISLPVDFHLSQSVGCRLASVVNLMIKSTSGVVELAVNNTHAY